MFLAKSTSTEIVLALCRLLRYSSRCVLAVTEAKVEDSCSNKTNMSEPKRLYIKLVRGRGLAAKDIGGTSDPYVRITTRVDWKSKVIDKTVILFGMKSLKSRCLRD